MRNNFSIGIAGLVFCAVGLISGCTNANAEADTVTVSTALGDVSGTTDQQVDAFLGIPYAAPPIADLRWAPPVSAEPWLTTFDATKFGPSCPQILDQDGQYPVNAETSEDCLSLNIWAPNEKDALHPVMFWIHGGGFLHGGSSAEAMNGQALAEQGVVVVTFNYRLGRLGFFAHPDLTAEASRTGAPIANYGIQDQIAALKWVHDNVASFGGDPDNVTIFGESAGGISVAFLMTSPAAEGLFQKAIIQSGGGRNIPISATGPSPDGGPSMEEVGENFARQFGIERGGLTKLRSLSAREVIGNVSMMTNRKRSQKVHWSIDGQTIVNDPISTFMKGTARKIPVMIGSTSDELGRIPMRDAITEFTLLEFGESGPPLRAAYETGDNTRLLSYLTGDALFAEPARFMARNLAASGHPVFHYVFDYVQSEKRNEYIGAPHATDVAFVFGNADTLGNHSAEDLAFSKHISAFWVRFAKTGEPGSTDQPWPKYSSEQAVTKILGPAPDDVLARNIHEEQLDALEKAYADRYWSDREP